MFSSAYRQDDRLCLAEASIDKAFYESHFAAPDDTLLNSSGCLGRRSRPRWRQAILRPKQSARQLAGSRIFHWSKRQSGSPTRCLVGKAEQTRGEVNPRFVVTLLAGVEAAAQPLYWTICCARGEMENGIKECRLICSLIAHPWRQ